MDFIPGLCFTYLPVDAFLTSSHLQLSIVHWVIPKSSEQLLSLLGPIIRHLRSEFNKLPLDHHEITLQTGYSDFELTPSSAIHTHTEPSQFYAIKIFFNNVK